MLDSFFTVKKQASVEITEKRSRFIGHASPINNNNDALDFINKIKLEHKLAKHNAFAYTLIENQITRFSDDKEPQGTAGKPALDFLISNKIQNTIVVVTRYFGGILLGTGGLSRAYSLATKRAVEAAEIIKMQLCKEINILCDYNQYKKISSLINNHNGNILDIIFTDKVNILFNIAANNYIGFKKQIVDLTSNKIEILNITDKYM